MVRPRVLVDVVEGEDVGADRGGGQHVADGVELPQERERGRPLQRVVQAAADERDDQLGLPGGVAEVAAFGVADRLDQLDRGVPVLVVVFGGHRASIGGPAGTVRICPVRFWKGSLLVTFFFGPRWDAPIMEGATEVPTPVGEPCTYCAESIADGDRGFARPVMSVGDDPGVRVSYVHAECELSGILGHDAGYCRCTGHEDTRATARLVWKRFFGDEPAGAAAG